MALQVQRKRSVNLGRLITTAVVALAFVAQPMYGLVAGKVASAEAGQVKTILAASYVSGDDCDRTLARPACKTIEEAIVISHDDDKIQLIGNFMVHDEITVDKRVTIDGSNSSNGHISNIQGWFSQNGSNNSIFELRAPAKINNINIDGKGHNLHGINAWHTNGVANVWNVTINNMGKSGIVVGEQAQVVAGDLSTSGNVWNAINVDKPGAWLKLAGINQFSEGKNAEGKDIPAVYFDSWNPTKVQFDNEYRFDHINRYVKSGDRAYFQKDNPIKVSEITLNGQAVNETDVTTANCDPVSTARTYYVGDSLDLRATVAPYDEGGVSISKATYFVVKQGANGCTHTNVYRSGNANLGQASPLDITGVQSGETYAAIIIINDADGNETRKYINFTADTEKPEVSIISTPKGNIGGVGSYNVSQYVTIDIEEDNLGATRVFDENDNVVQSYESADESSFSLKSGLKEGSYYIVHTDLAGNESEPVKFVVSRTKAAITNVQGINTGWLSVNKDNFAKFEVSKNGGSDIKEVQVRVKSYDSTKNNNWGATQYLNTVLGDAEREYTLNLNDLVKDKLENGKKYVVLLQARNEAGVHEQQYYVVQVDNVNPTAPVITGDLSDSTNTTRAISGTAEPGSIVVVTLGVLTEEVQADENGNWSVEFTGLGVGDHTVSVVAKDAAGNVSTARVAGFTILPVLSGRLNTVSTIRDLTSGPQSPAAITGQNAFGNVFLLPGETSDDDQDDNAAVLGAQTDRNGSSNQFAAAVPTADGWKIFGLMWYWWLLIVAAIAGAIWFIAAARRRNSDA